MSGGGVQRGAVEGLSPDMSFHAAADAAVRQRMKAVVTAIRRLDPDVEAGGVKPEQVHQLRVAVRRASAAVQAFGACFDEPRSSRLRKRLKKLRRAVGDARQCDVTIATLSHDFHANHGPGREAIGELIARVKSRRRTALRRLDRVLAHLTVRDIKHVRDAALDSLRPVLTPEGEEAHLMAAARAAIGRFTSELRDAGRGQLESAPALHELRLAGKRLRYAAEVFDCCFDKELAERAQEQIVALQDRLGAANDLYEIAEYIAAEITAAPKLPLIARGRPTPAYVDLSPVLAFYRERLHQAMNEFASWWRAGGGDRLCDAFMALVAADAAPSPRESAAAPAARRFPEPEEVFGEPIVLSGQAAANGSHERAPVR